MRWRELAVCISLCAGLAGCATSSLDLAPPRPDAPWMPATTSDGDIIAGKRSEASANKGYVLPANPLLSDLAEPPATDIGHLYSLAELVDLAESANPTTRIAWNDARRAALAAGIAQSAYLPRITAAAVGGYQGSHGHDSTAGENASLNGSSSGTVSTISLEWLLFDFGQRGAVVDAADQVSIVSNTTFTAFHQQVIYAVTASFYAYSAAIAHLGSAAQAVMNAQAVQIAAEARYKQGVGTVIEVDQAQQSAAQADLASVIATGGAQDAYMDLISSIGISPLTKIKIADVSDRALPSSVPPPVEAIIAESLARRPDVQSAYAAEKASLANIRVARAEFMPKVFLSGTGTYNSGGLGITAIPSVGQQSPTVNINGNRFGGSVFVGITVPLYDGGTRSATLGQARAEADSAAARLARTKEDAVRQIVIADSGLRTSLSTHKAALTLKIAAQTTFDAALAAYQNGVGSITEVTLAENQLLQARNATTDAYSNALSAAATLALATGALGGGPP